MPIHNQNRKWVKRCHWQGWSGESGQHRRIGMFHANLQTSPKWKIEESPEFGGDFSRTKKIQTPSQRGPRAQDPLGIEASFWNPALSTAYKKINERDEQVHIRDMLYVQCTNNISCWMLYFHVHGRHGVLNLMLNGLVCIRLLFRNLLLSAAPPVPAIYRWDCKSSRDLDDASYRLKFFFLFIFGYLADPLLAPFMHRRPAFRPINPHVRV